MFFDVQCVLCVILLPILLPPSISLLSGSRYRLELSSVSWVFPCFQFPVFFSFHFIYFSLFFSLISWLFLCAWYPLLYIFWFILVAFTQTKISRSQLFILANHTYILLAFSTLITLTSLCNFSSSDYKVQRVSSVCQLVYNLLVSAWL